MPAQSDILRCLDIHHVLPEHGAADAELMNWARWCLGGAGSRPGGWSAPMWREHWATRRREPGVKPVGPAVDPDKAMDTEHRVASMPAKVAAVVRWWYVRGGSPWAVARRIGRPTADLHGLLELGRGFLVAETPALKVAP